jgi:hypothetical protein
MYGDIPIDGGVVVQKVQRFMIQGSNLVVNITNIDTGRKAKINVAVRGILLPTTSILMQRHLALMVGTSNDGNNMGIDPATTLSYTNEWIHMMQVRDLRCSTRVKRTNN